MRFFVFLSALTALSACNSGNLPMDPSPQATIGESIAEPTDGFSNEDGF